MTYTVDTADDTEPVAPVSAAKDANGKTSLRAAIVAANQTAGTSRIEFNIPTTVGIAPLISLGDLLPETNHPMSIDATTQGDTVRLAPASGKQLDYGLFIVAGRSTVTGLQVEGFAHGIKIEVGGSNAIQGNAFVGNEVGIYLGTFLDDDDLGASSGNLIGGLTPEKKNFFLSNSICGVLAFHSKSNVIAGNVFGADEGGTAAGNGWGIILANCDKNVIGGVAADAGNIIVNSVRDGVFLAGSRKNVVLRNTITQNQRHGVVLCSAYTGPGELRHAIANRIGASSLDGTGNLISGNAKLGVLITSDAVVKGLNKVQGNLIGMDATGTTAVPNDTGVGIFGSSSNLVGGTKAGLPNVTSGNGTTGISIFAVGLTLQELLTDTAPATPVYLKTEFNIVQGNFIGTEPSANNAIGNGVAGVGIAGARSSVIGGTKKEAGNLIANNVTGIFITNTPVEPAILNQIIGNTIKKNPAHGVTFDNDVTGNVLGGKTKGLGNVIAGNGDGQANRFGVNMNDGAKNGVLGNSIVENGDGFTAWGIGGMGARSGIHLESLSRKSGKTIVTWTLLNTSNDPPGSTYRLEFFANSSKDGQGETYLGATMAKLVSGGDPTTGTMSLAGFPDNITATATLLGSKSVPVVTSEFSNVLENPPAALP